MRKKQKNVCRIVNCIILNYIALILISTVTGRVSISAFGSFVVIPIGIRSFVIRLKICIITEGSKKYKSVRKKKKHDKIVLLAKSK